MNKHGPAFALTVLILSGCATAARVDQMTVDSTASPQHTGDTPLKGSVSVETVSGGEGTNPLWTSEIGNEEFRSALENSLRAARLLATDVSESRYTLKATLVSVQQPMVGFDMTVTTTVLYALSDRSVNAAVFEKSITTPYTATVGDAFLGFERLKLANEGSARNNIAQLIDELYRLQITPADVSMLP
ncbi:MAG: hypothetical protein ACRES4_03165 [Nevskiales bacterium]